MIESSSSSEKGLDSLINATDLFQNEILNSNWRTIVFTLISFKNPITQKSLIPKSYSNVTKIENLSGLQREKIISSWQSLSEEDRSKIITTLNEKNDNINNPSININLEDFHCPFHIGTTKADGKRIDRRRRCKVCNKNTFTYCKACTYFLCIKNDENNNCFWKFHKLSLSKDSI